MQYSFNRGITIYLVGEFIMTCRKPAFAVLFAVVGYATVSVQADTTIYLSTQESGAAPGLLHERVPPNSHGTLHIWIDSDVRLAGVSLDLLESGGAIKFTGATLVDPSDRWELTAGPVISESSVVNLSGGAIPNLAGNGIGVGSPSGANSLYASVDYVALARGKSELKLREGGLLIATWEGGSPHVCFGTADCPIIGPPFPTLPVVGIIEVIPEPATMCLVVPALIGAVVVRRRSA